MATSTHRKTPTSRVEIGACGRTFSVAYFYENGWSAWCGKLDLKVCGGSAEHVLFNMQKAIEFTLSSQGAARRVHVSYW